MFLKNYSINNSFLFFKLFFDYKICLLYGNIIIYINLKYCKNYNKIHVNIYMSMLYHLLYYIIYLLLNSVFILISYQYLILFYHIIYYYFTAYLFIL